MWTHLEAKRGLSLREVPRPGRGHLVKFGDWPLLILYAGTLSSLTLTPGQIRLLASYVSDYHESRRYEEPPQSCVVVLSQESVVVQRLVDPRQQGTSLPALLTSPSFCTSGHERVYISASGCEIGFGPQGLQAAGAGGL